MYKRILLAYDGSEPGQQALLDSREIAQWSQAELTLVAVMPLPITAIGPEGGVYDERVEASEREHYQTIPDTGVRKFTGAGLSAWRSGGRGCGADCPRGWPHPATGSGGAQASEGWAARWCAARFPVLIEHAPCSVRSYPPKGRGMFRLLPRSPGAAREHLSAMQDFYCSLGCTVEREERAGLLQLRRRGADDRRESAGPAGVPRRAARGATHGRHRPFDAADSTFMQPNPVRSAGFTLRRSGLGRPST
jgi:hypothetical protein